MNQKISSDATVMQGVVMGENVTIGKCALIYPNVEIEDDVFIGPFCIIGEPTSDYYERDNHDFSVTKIGKGSIIRSHTTIYEGVTIGKLFQTGHHVTIREKTEIGDFCSIGTLSDIQGCIRMGDYVRLHSNVHIGQLTEIDDYVWIYPYVVTTNDPYPPMGILIGSHICKYAQIATGAIILPGKTIGENALVSAGALVTKDVPPETIAVGVPAKERGSVRDVLDSKGNSVYPWREHMTQYRGYPWQKTDE